MSSFNFDQVIKRMKTSSVKWDETLRMFGRDDVLPMWVADMDFQAPPDVTKTIIEKAKHGVFGYSTIPASNDKAIIDWFQKRHQWQLQPEWFTYISGVVPAISAAIQTFSTPGDKVMLFSPVYYPFYDMIHLNEREVVSSPLTYRDGRYYMDFHHLETQLMDNDVKILLLCNPHNPGGTVWSKNELTRLAELCEKHNVLVISDEIHADHVFTGHAYTPYARITAEGIICIAPTKTFNIAGLQAAVMVTPNKERREKLDLFLKKQGHFTLNMLGIAAMEAAYLHGEDWLEEVLLYIGKNMEIAVDFIEKEIPGLTAAKPEGTYLLWIDCRELGLKDEELKRLLLHKGKLALDFGKKFGQEGDGFVRMNVACPKDTLLEGLRRLKTAFA
jgi:cystathionine beta-lyase